MAERLSDVVLHRDVAVPIEVARRIKEVPKSVRVDAIAVTLQIPLEQVLRAGRNLQRSQYVATMSAWGAAISHFTDVAVSSVAD